MPCDPPSPPGCSRELARIISIPFAPFCLLPQDLDRFVLTTERPSFTMRSGITKQIRFRIETPSKCNMGHAFSVAYECREGGREDGATLVRSLGTDPVYVQTKRGGTTAVPKQHSPYDDEVSSQRKQVWTTVPSVHSLPMPGESSRRFGKREAEDLELSSRKRARPPGSTVNFARPMIIGSGGGGSAGNSLPLRESVLSVLEELHHKVDHLTSLVEETTDKVLLLLGSGGHASYDYDVSGSRKNPMRGSDRGVMRHTSLGPVDAATDLRAADVSAGVESLTNLMGGHMGERRRRVNGGATHDSAEEEDDSLIAGVLTSLTASRPVFTTGRSEPPPSQGILLSQASEAGLYGNHAPHHAHQPKSGDCPTTEEDEDDDGEGNSEHSNTSSSIALV